MKTIALTSTVFVLTAAGALAQQSDLEFLRARADAQERKISELEREVNLLKTYHVAKQHPKAVPVEAASAMASGEYVVKKGDMLGRIAKRHHTTVAAIKKANGLTSDHIRIGQKLRITGAGEKPVAVVSAPAQQPAAPAKTASKTAATHVVESGDTFYSIARKHGVTVASLKLANPKVDPKRILVGQKLSIDSNAQPAPKAQPRRMASKAKSAPKPKSSSPAKVAEAAPKPKTEQKKEVVRNAAADPKPATQSRKQSEPEIRTITVHKQITYGQFANQYGASTGQLNELNGLSLSKNTMLAIGSELYVPKD